MANQEFEYLVKGLLSGLGEGQKQSYEIKKELWKDSLRRRAEIADYEAKKKVDLQYTPKEWKPTTREEAMQFEREKTLLKPPTRYAPTTREEALAFEREKSIIPKPETVQDQLSKQKLEEGVIKKQEGERINQARANSVIGKAQDTLNTIKKVKEGKRRFGITGEIPGLYGSDKYRWQVAVDSLIANKITDTIAEMKSVSKTGATGFGQLNLQELKVLTDSATQLRKGLPPDEAMRILDTMEEKLNKIASSGGESVIPKEITLPSKGQAPRGAKGYNVRTKQWVF